MLVARILGKGQIVIPRDIRKKANLAPGDKVEVRMSKEGIVISPLKRSYTELFKGHIRGRLTLKKLERLYAEKT